jgi:phage-related protein
MPWVFEFHEAAVAEFEALPNDLQARLERVRDLVTEHGLDHLPPKLLKHISGKLWEFRLKGRDTIARAFYVTRRHRRIVIVHIVVKKSQKTPARSLSLALQRAEEVE